MDDQQHRYEVVAKNPRAFQMAKAIKQAVFDLQPQHQRLKNDQTGKGSQILIFKFQVGNFIGSTHYLAFAILHWGWPPATGILVIMQSYFTQS
jgi:hypothetical protein